MSFNYNKLAATARRLVERFGRTVTLVKYDHDEDNLINPAKPWRGVQAPRGADATEVVQSMVFVEPSSAEKFGLKVEMSVSHSRIRMVGLLAPGPGDTNSYAEFDEIIDGNLRWKIMSSNNLIPGPVPMIYFFTVER